MAEDAAGGQNSPGDTPGGLQDGGQDGGAGGDAGAAQETVAAMEEPLIGGGEEETQGTPPSSEGTPAQPGEDDNDSTEADKDSDATEKLESQDNDGHEDNAPAPPSQGDAGSEDVVTPPATGGVTFSGTKDEDATPPPRGGMRGPLKDKAKATQQQGRALTGSDEWKTSEDRKDSSPRTVKELDMQIAALNKEKALALRDEQSPPTWDDNSSADVFMPKENGTHANKEKPLVQSRNDRKHWSQMTLMDFVKEYYPRTDEEPMVFKDQGKKHSFFTNFRVKWVSGGEDLSVQDEDGKHAQGKDLVDYIQEFMEYLARLNMPWERLLDTDLYLIFEQGLMGKARSKWKKIRGRRGPVDMRRTFEEDFGEFTSQYLLSIRDLGRKAVKELMNAEQREGEDSFQYWARLKDLLSSVTRENSSFQEWNESDLMGKWVSSLSWNLYEHVTHQRRLNEDNAGYANIPDMKVHPEAFRGWVRAQEATFAAVWAPVRKRENRVVDGVRRQGPRQPRQQGQRGPRQQGFYNNRGPAGQGSHKGGRNNGSSPFAAVAQVNAVNGDNRNRDNRVKNFQERFGVFPGAPIIPKTEKDRKQRVQHAKKIGVCLGCHQQGHISSDPQCPAKNDTRWHSGKFYNKPQPGNVAHVRANVVAEPDYNGGFQDYGDGAQDYGYGVQGAPSHN